MEHYATLVNGEVSPSPLVGLTDQEINLLLGDVLPCDLCLLLPLDLAEVVKVTSLQPSNSINIVDLELTSNFIHSDSCYWLWGIARSGVAISHV